MKNVKSVITIVTITIFSSPFISLCQATLTQVDGPVYKTDGFYAGETNLYWYLDISPFYNKTLDEQVEIINQMNVADSYGFSNWHLASEEEIYNLVELYMWSDKNRELAAVIELSPSGYKHFRYDKTMTEEPYNHYQIKLWVWSGDWIASRETTYWDTQRSLYLGALVVATPEPSTLMLIGFGILFTKRKNVT